MESIQSFNGERELFRAGTLFMLRTIAGFFQRMKHVKSGAGII